MPVWCNATGGSLGRYIVVSLESHGIFRFIDICFIDFWLIVILLRIYFVDTSKSPL